MKKYLKITSLGITLFVIGLFGFSKIDANALADPNDIFTIVSPAPNSKVSGTANISVRIYDDEQAAVYVQSNLFDRETCNTTNYGTVSSISTLSSNPGQNSTISWNTTNVNDGTYCLKLCASFVNGGEGYSVCNGREVQVVNNNSLPTITSQLNKTQYIEGESFSYQLTASDPDGDSLTYRLVAAPEILTINPQNGLITSGALSTFGYPGLEYTVTVGVSDGISGEVTQNFKFSVVKPTPPPTTIPDNNQPTTPDTQVPDNQTPDDQTPDETDVITDTDIENGLNFTQPIADTVFTDEQNLIKWTLPNGVELESLSLEYSTDGEEWLLISDSIEPTRTYYFWDMSELQDGKYYVRITIETKDGRKFVKQSEQFEVNIDPNNDGDTIESAPLIINVMPENDS
ncbi:hypothetical protein KC678_04435, partial [Candidatus Dojkabacteria bacterium]|nr:hypothetical protein [Candidatus Dojkabacteria bacterium]